MVEIERGERKVKEGIVVGNKMAKTVTVKVTRRLCHPTYGKVIERAKKYYVHVEQEKPALGQKVRIMETRPISKLKRWRLIEGNEA